MREVCGGGSWEGLKTGERGRSDTNLSQRKHCLKKEKQNKLQVSSRPLKFQSFVCPNTGTERCSFIPQTKEQKEGFASLTDSRAEHFVLTMY